MSLRLDIDCAPLPRSGVRALQTRLFVCLFTVFESSIEARQHVIDFTRRSNEHCLARQPRAIDTHLYTLSTKHGAVKGKVVPVLN
jgi:hypothetical protein